MTTTPLLSDKDDKRAKRRAYEAEYRARNREKLKQDQAEWRARNPEKKKLYSPQRRVSDLRRKYGLSEEQFEHLFNLQGRCCAICNAASPGTKHGSWAVDHCHDTNIVRGLLCHRCNLMLGHARDDTGFLASAISYLQNPPANAVLH